MGNELHLELIDLAGLAVRLNGYTVIPIKLDTYFDTGFCSLVLRIYNDKNMTKTVTRKGKFEDGIFKTSVNNIKILVNVKTGVIKKDRK